MEINEKSVSKQQQKFFGVVRGIQTGEIKSASPAAKKAAASMSKKDVKDFAATKHKGLPKKVDELKTTKETVKSADKKPEVFTKPDGKRGVRMVSVDREVVKTEETDDIKEKGKGLWHNIRAKRKRGEPRAKPGDKDYPKTLDIEGYIGGKGEKGRDKGNAGKFDKNTAYSHAKTHNGVVHKDTSGSYLVKHGRGKNVSEESVAELSTKTLQSFADKSWKNPKRAQGVKTAAGKIVKKALEKESTYTAKVPKKHDPSKDISVADYKKKTGKKTVSLKHLTKNTHVNPFTEESFDLDEAAINFRKLHQEIMAYAKKHGDIDKEDFEKVASYIKEIGDNQNKPDRANLRFATMKAFVAGMDTDPRDKVYSWLKKYGMFKNGKMVQESESVDEVYRKPPTPIGGKGSSAKYKETEMEYQRDQELARKRKQQKPAKKESTDAYGKSMDAIANKKKKAAISKPDLDKLSKLNGLALFCC